MVGVYYVANISGGKDSIAMTLRIMEECKPLTHGVFYDTGMEFSAIYRNIEKIQKLLTEYGAVLKVIKPNTGFLEDMLIRPVNIGKENEHYGYDWCGGVCRWRTKGKMEEINRYLKALGEYKQYIGIAADEPKRVRDENNKVYPLLEWDMTEKQCLEYCYSHGFDWNEDGIELYSILDRVSCWCCANKNLKELRNIYHYLPKYWNMLKGLQSRIDRPFKKQFSIFDLERRFAEEDKQISFLENF